MAGTIGRVVATEKSPSTTNKVEFWIEKDVVIKPFDVVMIKHLKDSKTYAIRAQVHHRLRRVSFGLGLVGLRRCAIDATQRADRHDNSRG